MRNSYGISAPSAMLNLWVGRAVSWVKPPEAPRPSSLPALAHARPARVGKMCRDPAGHEVPSRLHPSSQLGIPLPDLFGGPNPMRTQILVDEGDGNPWRVEIDFLLAGKGQVARLVVLRLGHQHEIAEC